MIKRNYKTRLRRNSLIIAIFIFLVSLFGCGNRENAKAKFNYERGNLYVNYLSVGTSDCVVIRFPNDKILLIDTANENTNNQNKIKQTLNNLGAKSIDYLILSHPDIDHYGNALALLESFSITEIYAPNVDKNAYLDFCFVLDNAMQKGSVIKNTTMFSKINEEDTTVYFLYDKSSEEKSDLETISTEIATTDEADNLSPIILLEYKGIEFLFSGDTSARNERKVIEKHKNNQYTHLFNKELNLTNIDYYMLSSHGSSFGSSMEFLEYVKPKNAIISVSEVDASYGTPNIEKIEKLTHQNCRVLRSDFEGDIVVSVNKNGGTALSTELDLNNN